MNRNRKIFNCSLLTLTYGFQTLFQNIFFQNIIDFESESGADVGT